MFSLLIINLITAMLTSQPREIGVMKSLGARAGQIAVMYLGFAFLLGLLRRLRCRWRWRSRVRMPR